MPGFLRKTARDWRIHRAEAGSDPATPARAKLATARRSLDVTARRLTRSTSLKCSGRIPEGPAPQSAGQRTPPSAPFDRLSASIVAPVLSPLGVGRKLGHASRRTRRERALGEELRRPALLLIGPQLSDRAGQGGHALAVRPLAGELSGADPPAAPTPRTRRRCRSRAGLLLNTHEEHLELAGSPQPEAFT